MADGHRIRAERGRVSLVVAFGSERWLTAIESGLSAAESARWWLFAKRTLAHGHQTRQ